MDVVFLVSLEKKKSMTSPIRIKALVLALSQSAIRLFLRYFVGMVVGIIPIGTSILFQGGNNPSQGVITLYLFVIALPSILVWHFLNEALRLSNFEVKYREHITAFVVASIMLMLFVFHRMADLLESIEFSILACLFIFFAVLNSYLYVMLCRRFLSNIGC